MKLPLKQDQHISDALREDSLSRSNVHFSSIISPDNITECPRRMYYRVKATENTKENSFLEMVREHFIAERWAYYFSKCKKFILVDKKIHVSHSEYNIGGTIDAYVEFDDCRYMVKVKPLSEDEFQTIKEKGPKRRHVIEAIIYLWLSEVEDGLLIYENNNSQDYIIYTFESYEPILRSVKDKCKSLIRSQISGVIPPRIIGSNAKKECKVCEYNGVCLK